ncbi:MAG: hypothetical protein ABWZ98_12740 [Nakamurella sp.]
MIVGAGVLGWVVLGWDGLGWDGLGWVVLGDWLVGSAVGLPGPPAAGQSMVIDGAAGGLGELVSPGVEDAAGSGAAEPVTVVSGVELPPGALPAAQGTAQALVPAINETPTAAAISREAAAGAIRRSRIRPHRPGRPGNPAAVSAHPTAQLQSSKTQTSTLAASSIACSATARTATGAPAAGRNPLSWPGHDQGAGSRTARVARPTTHPAN